MHRQPTTTTSQRRPTPVRLPSHAVPSNLASFAACRFLQCLPRNVRRRATVRLDQSPCKSDCEHRLHTAYTLCLGIARNYSATAVFEGTISNVPTLTKRASVQPVPRPHETNYRSAGCSIS